MQNEQVQVKKNPFMSIKRHQLLFYIGLVSLPVLQFLIFYVYLNFNGLTLSFKSYDDATSTYYYPTDGNIFVNYEKLWRIITDPTLDGGKMKYSIQNSIPLYLMSWVLWPISMMTSYPFYKKFPGDMVFFYIMILPSMFSTMVMSLTFKYIADRAVPTLWKALTGEEIYGLMANPDTAVPTQIVLQIYTGLGGGMLVVGIMRGSVSDELIEAASLDGCGMLSELWYIGIPCIWPLLHIQIAEKIVSIWGVNFGQFGMYGAGAPTYMYTFGYYFQVLLLKSNGAVASPSQYPFVSAFNNVKSLLSIPIVLIARKFLENVYSYE